MDSRDLIKTALDIAYDLAVAHAEDVHLAYAGYKPDKHKQADEDVSTIKATMEAHAQEQSEPVAWHNRKAFFAHGGFTCANARKNKKRSDDIPLYTSAQLAQEHGEPVYFVRQKIHPTDAWREVAKQTHDSMCARDTFVGRVLYASPQPAQELLNELRSAIFAIYRKSGGSSGGGSGQNKYENCGIYEICSHVIDLMDEAAPQQES